MKRELIILAVLLSVCGGCVAGHSSVYTDTTSSSITYTNSYGSSSVGSGGSGASSARSAQTPSEIADGSTSGATSGTAAGTVNGYATGRNEVYTGGSTDTTATSAAVRTSASVWGAGADSRTDAKTVGQTRSTVWVR